LSLLLPLKTIFKHLILPPSGSLLIALLGLIVLRRRPQLGKALLILGIGSLWLISTPIVSDLLARAVERYPPLNFADAASAQAVVILGGGGQRGFAPEYSGPAAEPYLLERLAYGAYVAKKTNLPVLVTGFHLEAHAMHDTLQRNFGLDTKWIDDNAYDTFQNAQNSARILKADGITQIILVTRGTHLGRSVEEFAATGLKVIPAPSGALADRDQGIFRWLPDPDALLRSHMAIYEMLGEPVRAFLSATGLRHQ
jgi:uncharacterized SAM-binding protein YcdF (DUF218 family)